ncbi:cold-shock DNA binding protein [Chrysochromulina tobinii]|uniref:Cold-shock DNA binding protein n=1 Tax=Chrysochromulina tobinii TaxID=1460289 RepID=A0A0M0JPE3_9EUKA|nr:cold-shock DNA binding protein [Chrysochromulina tobinii]|eukprot:KOO28118.1 cold-shock DNA binding protein [Chrysochromulina sp. CCMP291]
MARGLILCLLHALAVASALVITPAVRAVRLAPRAACPTMDGDGPMVGKCKWFNVEKGYGFISIDNENRDVFVHQSDIYAPGFRTLAEGEALEFRLTTDPKTGKVKAVDVTGPDGAYVQGAPRQAKGGEDEYY